MIDLDHFRKFALDLGVTLPDEIRVDGLSHQAKTERARGSKKSASYLVFAAGNGGWVNNHQDDTGLRYFWEKGAARGLSPEERERIHQAQEDSKAEREKERLGAVVASLDDWAKSSPASGHYPYLTNPALPDAGLRVRRGRLMVPIMGINLENEVQWVGSQHIDGFAKPGTDNKRFQKGTPPDQSFAVVPIFGKEPESPLESFDLAMKSKSVALVEGIGTALAVHQATGMPVVAALYAGNMSRVAGLLKDRFEGRLFIVADLDGEKAVFKGISATMDAAQTFGENSRIAVVMPHRDKLVSGYDARDFSRDYGAAALRAKMVAAMPEPEFRARYPVLTGRAIQAQSKAHGRVSAAEHGTFEPETGISDSKESDVVEEQDQTTAKGQKAATSEAKETKPRRDLREEVTKKMVASLEIGKIPWERPWIENGDGQVVAGFGKAVNAVTGAAYNGGNRFTLSLEALEKGYQTNKWCTFNQAKSKEWHIRKGEHASPIEVWKENPFYYRRDLGTITINDGNKPIRVKETGAHHVKVSGSDEEIPKSRLSVNIKGPVASESLSFRQAEEKYNTRFAVAYNVFNIAQMENVPENVVGKTEKLSDIVMENKMAQIVEGMQKDGLRLGFGGDRALYRRGADLVQMPMPEQFKDKPSFHSTLLHEIGHSTGHENRLNRQFGQRKGDAQYAREELRAEIFSFMMAVETGIPHKHEEQHQSYIQSWAQALKNDKNEIYAAARDASKAVDYVTERAAAIELTHQQNRSVERAKAIGKEGSDESKAPGVMVADTHRGEYAGKIIKVDGNHIIQTGEDKKVIVHNRTKLTRDKTTPPLKSGTDVSVAYRDGKGTVQKHDPAAKAKAKQKSQEQSQSHGR
jgi:antirestriction protein ArdC/phage/plasmid primase-like uncharacterized protein